ncbi:MAG: AI-2E family transporter [Clostridia bacterium]|nr:AI-2E family transporter [Clostridia bacterium]
MKNTKLLALVLLLVAVVAAIWRFWSVVMLFFVAALIAYILGPLVKLLTFKGKIPRAVAVIITVLIVLGLIAWGLVLLIPYAVTQISGVVDDLVRYASNFDQLLQEANALLASWHLPRPILDWATDALGKSDVYLTNLFRGMLSGMMNATTSIFNVVIVLILTVYFMLDGAKLLRSGVDRLPEHVRHAARRVLRESDRYFWKYLGTRVLISLGMALVSYIGFSIIGLKYAALFAALSFVMDFIPYFGSLIAGAVEGVFALITGGVSLAVKVVIFILVVQQIEGNVVAPKVQSNAVDIHPLWVMFSLLVCSKIWGPVGMLISTPVAVVVKAVFREVYHYIISPDRVPAGGPAEELPAEHEEPEPPAVPADEGIAPPEEDEAPAAPPAPAEQAPPAHN